MSVPYLRDATSAGETDKLIRFVRLHLGDGNEETGRKEIDKSWAEAVKILLRYDPVDESAIARVLSSDESTLALLYFNLNFYLIRKSEEWIHDGSRKNAERSARDWNATSTWPLAHGKRPISWLYDRE